MALSSISTLASASMFNKTANDNGWGPILFIFPTSLSSFTINSNNFTYSLGSGTNVYRNGEYKINANCWRNVNPPYLMFDNNPNTFFLSGVNGGVNYKLDGTTSTYNRNAYTINTAPAPYVGGNSNGTSTFNTNGIAGEYYQIEYPFNYVLKKIYIRGQSGVYYSRSPKKLYIYGSSDGITWIFIVLITTAVANATNEYAYNVSNTTQYKFYRFVGNTLVGGHSWDGAMSIGTFRTEGDAYSLEI
jgi:hypothetical protein